MAQDIENAYKSEWKSNMGENVNEPEINDHFRLLCVAIAQGVIKHICDQHEAFSVTVNVGENNITYKINIAQEIKTP